MDNNLIIFPCGKAPTFHDAYDKENHWRFNNKEKRRYKTLAVIYNDYVPEPNTFDYAVKMTGLHKWEQIKLLTNASNDFEDNFFSKFDFIGCVDDDQITDIHNMNRGLELAHQFGFDYWQLSMLEGSNIFYDCLKQNKNWTFSQTNFIEMGNCQFSQKKFQELLVLLNKWSNIRVAYGLDKVWYDWFQCNANVVHDASIFHPYHISYYDNHKEEVMSKMYHFLNVEYPNIVKDVYNRESRFRDVQETIHAFVVEN